RTFTATTDSQGNFKIEGLVAGTYEVVISAKSFASGRVDEVKVEDGAVAQVNLALELAPVEAAVTVGPGTIKANADPVYQDLRQKSKSEQSFSGDYATVINVVLKRDAGIFTLKSGEVYFLTPV